MAEPETPLLKRRAVLGATEETTSGTAESVSAALSNTTTYNATLEPLDMHSGNERAPDGLYEGHVASVAGKRLGRLRFTMEHRYGDQFLSLLTGAGFYNDSGTYKPTSSMASRKTWTWALWEDGRKKMLSGAVGNFTLEWTNGGTLRINWEWTGIWIAPTDEAMPAQAPSTHTGYLYKALGATATIGGSALPMHSRGTITPGNTMEERGDITAAAGVLHMLVAGRAPRCTLDTEARLVAAGAPYAAMLAGTEAALSFAFGDGNDPEKTLTVAAPKAQRLSPITDGERGGLRVDNVNIQLNVSSGDDWLTFAEA